MSMMGKNALLVCQERIQKAQELIPADVQGWCEDFAWLYAQQVEQAVSSRLRGFPYGDVEKAPAFVEIGSWLGRSTILMAKLIKASGKKIDFWCVDHFKGSGDVQHFQPILNAAGGTARPIFEHNLARHGVRDLVEVLEMTSLEAAAKFVDNTLDFVFIDGDHAYENVRADIQAWLPKVKKPGGLLAGHDWNYLGVTQAVCDTLPGPIYVSDSAWWYHVP